MYYKSIATELEHAAEVLNDQSINGWRLASMIAHPLKVGWVFLMLEQKPE